MMFLLIYFTAAILVGSFMAMYRPIIRMHPIVFYLLSFTWGIVFTIIGMFVAAALILLGKKPKRYGLVWNFELPVNFGLNLGIFIITPINGTKSVRDHEMGHGLQNACLGPLVFVLVCIPSVIRYWYRIMSEKSGAMLVTKYDDIWFEGQASDSGFAYFWDREQ